MKKLVMMMALAVSMAVNAAEKNDSTIVDFGDDDDSGSVLKAKKTPFDMDLSKEDEDGWTTHSLSTHIGVGFTAPTNVPSGMSFATFRSWELQWTIVQYEYRPKNKWQTYSIGIGLNWRNYVLKTDKAFYKGGNGEIGLTDWNPQYSDKHSNIHVASISVPILFTQKFDKEGHFKLSLGPFVNFNTSADITNRYSMGDDDVKVSTNHIGQRPVTIDFMGIFRVYGVGLYCKYSPNSVLKSGRGPQFRSLSFGLYF